MLQVDQYLVGLGVEDLPGVGWSMKQQLHQMGIRTVADVRQRSCPSLQKDVGEKKGLKLWEAAYGKDDRCCCKSMIASTMLGFGCDKGFPGLF
jgi:DNA repair protein REV1